MTQIHITAMQSNYPFFSDLLGELPVVPTYRYGPDTDWLVNEVYLDVQGWRAGGDDVPVAYQGEQQGHLATMYQDEAGQFETLLDALDVPGAIEWLELYIRSYEGLYNGEETVSWHV